MNKIASSCSQFSIVSTWPLKQIAPLSSVRPQPEDDPVCSTCAQLPKQWHKRLKLIRQTSISSCTCVRRRALWIANTVKQEIRQSCPREMDKQCKPVNKTQCTELSVNHISAKFKCNCYLKFKTFIINIFWFLILFFLKFLKLTASIEPCTAEKHAWSKVLHMSALTRHMSLLYIRQLSYDRSPVAVYDNKMWGWAPSPPLITINSQD